MALIFKILVGLLTVGRGVMMIDVAIVVVLFAVLLIAASAEAFSEVPRDMRDVLCFLAMLAVGVAVVLVFTVGGPEMAYNDMKVATFSSKYRGGDVGLWYCLHNRLYALRYTVRFRTSGGFCDASAWRAYDAADESQVADLMLDAIDIARTPLMERD